MARIASLSEVDDGVAEVEDLRFLTAEATVIEGRGERAKRKRGEQRGEVVNFEEEAKWKRCLRGCEEEEEQDRL